MRWGFATADGRPYVAVQHQQLQGGFTYLLGKRAGERLGIAVEFVETPNNRVEDFLMRGRIHVICNATPDWIDQPHRFHWSPVLYSEEDVLASHTRQPDLNSLETLHGKTLGTQLGYVYHSALMKTFATGQVTRQDLRDIATGLHLLRAGRMDAVIGMRRTLTHQLSSQPDKELRINSWVIERHEIQCLYSPELPVDAAQLDEVLQELRDAGQIEAMFDTL